MSDVVIPVRAEREYDVVIGRGLLAHLPRIWGYLGRNLAHPELRALARWYDTHFPLAERRRTH